MAIPHVAGDTFGPVSNCSASASTGELFWQHKYSSQVYLRKVNLFRNTLKVLHGFTGKTVLGSSAVKGRFVRTPVVRSGRSECRLLDTRASIRQSRLAWRSGPDPIKISHQRAQPRRLLLSLFALIAVVPPSTAAQPIFGKHLKRRTFLNASRFG
jgi:hypothetical protein